MRTVLVLYASCGAGHRRAAEAIAAAHAEAGAGAGRVVLRDVLGFVPAWLRHLYRDGYLALARHEPGGLTTTEAAVAGVPLILTCGIPGQEEGNARHFIGQGAALDGSTPALAAEALGRLYDEPDLAPSILRTQSRIARPEAAAAILRLAGASREAAA